MFGWSLFGYWWFVVLAHNEPVSVLFTVAVVILIADALILLAWGWIFHNRRLARRGSRGLATAFAVPEFHRDGVDRKLILPERDELLESAEVVITSTVDEKVYRTALNESS